MSTETLRPNAIGDETSITSSSGATHWGAVNEEVADDAASYIYTKSATYLRDLYNLPAHSVGSGTINFIKIYFRCSTDTSGARAKPSLKSDSTVTDGTEITPSLYPSWTTYSQTWATNPADSAAWEWADIDALQIGVSLHGDGTDFAYCTQVYVEIDYTVAVNVTVEPPAATGNSEGLVPTLSISLNLLPPQATTDAEGLIPNVGIGELIEAVLATCSAEGFAPSLSIGINLLPPQATADIEGLIPTLSINLNLLPAAASADSEALIPIIDVSIVIDAVLATCEAEGLSPTLSIGSNLLPPPATATAEGLTPTLFIGLIILSPTASATCEALAPILSLGVTISAPVATADAVALVARLITQLLRTISAANTRSIQEANNLRNVNE